MKKTIPIIAAIIVVGVLAFYGGMKFSDSKSLQTNSFRNFQGQAGQGAGGNLSGRRGGAQGGNGNIASGQIMSGDDKSITVSLPGGGSKIIFFSATTKISKFVDAAVTDLTTGINIMATGTTNSDGSITATSIQIRPAMPQNQQPPQQPNQQPQQQPTQQAGQ